jgi:NADPH:quinone reductase-like Zn-dependent oxidoreductase
MRSGCDFSGTVVRVGSSDGGSFQVGDAVYGCARFDSMGSFAEYLAVDTTCLALKPTCLTFNEAAAVPLVAQTSFQALVDCGKTQKHERVLILGASGGTGSFAVQIAKALGAYVVATTSTRNAEFVKELGADEVIDYTSQDWASVVPPHSIDVLYDCGVEPNCWNDRAQQVLKRQTGRFVSIGWMIDPIESPIGATWQRLFASPRAATLEQVGALIEEAGIKVAIDSVYPLDKLPDALARQKTKRARGKIVVQVEDH